MTGVGLCLPQLGPHVTVDALERFVTEAERLGFSSLWVQDHFLYPLEPKRGYGGREGTPVPPEYRSVMAPLELLAFASARTTRVALGTSVLVAGNHWPAPLAQRLATLDVLSDGRLIVGLGAGWSAEEHEAAGSDITTRGDRLDEFVAALTACWAPDPVAHEGRFFTIAPSIMAPKPVQRPRPKLISGMGSARGLVRTAALFDGWNPAGRPAEGVADTVAELDRSRPPGSDRLSVYHRVFLQGPHQDEPEDPVGFVAAELEGARRHGFDEVIIEANFWDAIASPAHWAELPERLASALELPAEV